MESSKKVTFNGKGDVNVFLTMVNLYRKRPAINVYMLLDEDDRMDIKKIQAELRKQYEVGNADRD